MRLEMMDDGCEVEEERGGREMKFVPGIVGEGQVNVSPYKISELDEVINREQPMQINLTIAKTQRRHSQVSCFEGTQREFRAGR